MFKITMKFPYDPDYELYCKSYEFLDMFFVCTSSTGTINYYRIDNINSIRIERSA
jgi:hypothetical protein